MCSDICLKFINTTQKKIIFNLSLENIFLNYSYKITLDIFTRGFLKPLSIDTDSSNNTFQKNLREAIKTFLTLVCLIFCLVLSFYLLTIIFPTNVTMEPSAFVFGYIVAIPFMIVLSLYPFGKK